MYEDYGKPFPNTLTDLAQFFSTDTRAVSINEFMEFWESLSENERWDYRYTTLS